MKLEVNGSCTECPPYTQALGLQDTECKAAVCSDVEYLKVDGSCAKCDTYSRCEGPTCKECKEPTCSET